MGIYKKGNVYWFIKQYEGRRYEESLGTSIKRLAEEIYASKLQAILKGEYDKPEIRSYTFRELAEKYLE
jgi:CTP:molybdopterin cytidylyltransferase MocA